MYGERELAEAVINQAIKDACSKVDSYNRKSARNFLTAITPFWAESLELWAEMAGLDVADIIRKYRDLYYGK